MLAFAGAVGLCGAADNGSEPPRSDSVVEIRQRLIDTGVEDDTTAIEVTIRNKSNAPVEDVVVRGPMPKGHDLRSSSPALDEKAAELQWSFQRLAGGEEKKIRLQFSPIASNAPTDLKVDLRVAFRGGATSVLETPAKQPPPRLSIAVPEIVNVGVPATIKVQVAPAEGRSARDLMLQANLGDGLSHVGGRELENELGAIEAGQTRVVRLEAIPTKAGELRGRIRVRGNGTAWTEREFTLVAHEIGLAVSTTAPPTCEVNAAVPITIGIRHDGNEVAKRVRLVIRPSQGLVDVSAPSGNLVPDDRCILFDLGDLKPGERRAVRVTGRPDRPGELSLAVTLSSATYEPRAHAVSIFVREDSASPPPPAPMPLASPITRRKEP
jgi:hypothetical protein